MVTLKIMQRFLRCRQIAKAAIWAYFGLIAALMVAGFGQVEAATIYATDVSLVAVQAAVDSASIGDTVMVPAGITTWTNTLWITNDIQIIGAGIGQTIITNYYPKAPYTGNDMVNWVTQNGFCRWSGFSIAANVSYVNTFNIQGTSHAFRADHCYFDSSIGTAFIFSPGWVYGVVDHCTFNNVHIPFQVHHDTYGGYDHGNGSWADADNWGTTNAMYIEDCTFTCPASQGANGIADGYGGARIVIRYCTSTNVFEGTHGTDSTGASRGARTLELYCNNFQWPTNQAQPYFYVCCQLRSGTAVVFSNTVYGGWQTLLGNAEYRANTMDAYAPWGMASGANSWDSNSPTIFDSGTAMATVTNLTDNTKAWTINQWLGYSLYNTNQNWGTIITSNNANTIFYVPFDVHYDVNGIKYTFNNGDHYQIRKLLAVLDQPGFGQSDLLITDSTGSHPINSLTGGLDWPHEVSDPIYVWGNDYNCQAGNGIIIDNSTTVSGNRDYVIGTPRPGYTPLVYPHPLTGVASPQATNPPAIFSQPQGQTVPAGSSVYLAVAAMGSDLTYTWLANGVPIAGATNNSLTLSSALASNTANYSVIVSNSFGTVTSAAAVVTVTPTTAPLSPPSDLIVFKH